MYFYFRKVVRFLTTVLQSLTVTREDENEEATAIVYDSYISQYSAIVSALTVAKAVIMIGTTLDAV